MLMLTLTYDASGFFPTSLESVKYLKTDGCCVVVRVKRSPLLAGGLFQGLRNSIFGISEAETSLT